MLGMRTRLERQTSQNGSELVVSVQDNVEIIRSLPDAVQRDGDSSLDAAVRNTGHSLTAVTNSYIQWGENKRSLEEETRELKL